MRIWAYTRAKDKIKTQVTFTALSNDLADMVATACEKMKLPRPMILSLHETDFERFGFTVFKQDQFVEDLGASELQIRKLPEEKPMTLHILHED